LQPLIFGTVYSTTVARFPEAVFGLAAALVLVALGATFLIRTETRHNLKGKAPAATAVARRRVLVAEREVVDFFEAVAKGRDAKAAANWVINELAGRLNREGKDIASAPVSASQLGAILDLIAAGTISGKIAKDLFEIVWTEGGDPHSIVETRGMKQVTDLSAIEHVVDDIVAKNSDKVEQAKGKPALIGWFVGQVMKASGGKASPQVVNDLLKRKLGI